jgi:transcription elongation factor
VSAHEWVADDAAIAALLARTTDSLEIECPAGQVLRLLTARTVRLHSAASIHASVPGARAEACAAAGFAVACAAGAVAEARVAGAHADAWGIGTRSETRVAGGVAEAWGDGARAEAWGAGARAVAWGGAVAVARKGAVAEAHVSYGDGWCAVAQAVPDAPESEVKP